VLDKILEPLGYTNKRFAYYSPVLRRVDKLTPRQHNDADLCAYATLDEWTDAIGQENIEIQDKLLIREEVNNEFIVTDVNWKALRGELMKRCRILGKYREDTERGRGLWPDDDGTLVFNTGSELYRFDQDGNKTGPFELHQIANDSYRYVATTPTALPPADEPASSIEGQDLFNSISIFEWSNPSLDPILVTGWIVGSTILNLLDYRPHVAIKAPRGAGKSALVANVVKLFNGPSNCFRVEMDLSTEPGIRQTVAADALPLICDEFETNTPTTERVFPLLRTASNPNGGGILKGSPEGKAQEFFFRTMALVAGIKISFPTPGDATRFAVVALNQRKHTEEQRQALGASFKALPFDLLPRVQKRMILSRFLFAGTLQAFRVAISERFNDDRMADLYGNILSAYWIACYEAEPTDDEVMKIVALLPQSRDDDQDATDCWNYLLSYKLPYPIDMTVYEALDLISSANSDDLEVTKAERGLQAIGVKYHQNTKNILIANKHSALAKLFETTPWKRNGHTDSLKELGAGNHDNKVVNFGGVRTKVSTFPISALNDGVTEGQAVGAGELGTEADG